MRESKPAGLGAGRRNGPGGEGSVPTREMGRRRVGRGATGVWGRWVCWRALARARDEERVRRTVREAGLSERTESGKGREWERAGPRRGEEAAGPAWKELGRGEREGVAGPRGE